VLRFLNSPAKGIVDTRWPRRSKSLLLWAHHVGLGGKWPLTWLRMAMPVCSDALGAPLLDLIILQSS
jgi:hypothetical protein